jgi:hypothetical protein
MSPEGIPAPQPRTGPEDPALVNPPAPEVIRPAPDYLNSENQRLLDRMSDHGQKMAKSLYEGVYATPGVNRMAGKLQMAYNQFWADRHEKKAAKQKTKMDTVGMEMQAHDKAKNLLQSQIEKLRQKGLPGVEELELEVKKMEREQLKLANKKDGFQTKFEARQNKLKSYTNERDRVADKLIAYYDERLEPLEKDLSELKREGDRLGVLAQALAASHVAEEADLKRTEKDISDIEETLRLIGKSEGAIGRHRGLNMLREEVETQREKMKEEKEALAQERAELNKEIVRLDERANPKRDIRDAYARVKQNRPLDMNVSTRQRVAESGVREEPGAHTRENPFDASAESEGQETAKVSEYVDKWNQFLSEKDALNATGLRIDARDFIGVVGSVWGPDSQVQFKDLKKVVEAYYKFKRVEDPQLNEKFNEFYKTKIKQNP